MIVGVKFQVVLGVAKGEGAVVAKSAKCAKWMSVAHIYNI